MSTITAELDGHTVVIKNGGDDMIRLNLKDLGEYLSDDDKLRIAEIIGWGPVMKQALRRLRGTAEWYCYTDDAANREEVLAELGLAHADYIARCEASRREAWEAAYKANELATVYTTYFRDALYQANGDTYDGLPENVRRVLQSGHYGVAGGLAKSMERVKATCAELRIVVSEGAPA